MNVIGKRILGGVTFLTITALLFIETCLTMSARFGQIDFSTALFAVCFVISPFALAAIFAFLAKNRLIKITSWLLGFATLLLAILLLYMSFSSRSSTAVIALVFWPIVEAIVLITALGLLQLIITAFDRYAAGIEH